MFNIGGRGPRGGRRKFWRAEQRKRKEGEGGEADATTIQPPPPPPEKEEEKWELGMQPENRGKETSRGGNSI